MTSFQEIYDCFFSKITDDMYLELTEQDTQKDCKNILLNSLPLFEFPRFDLNNYDKDTETFNVILTSEEINIIASNMVLIWLERQLNSVENIRMKYSGNDFKFTSQANHLGKLITLDEFWTKKTLHLQRLYKRRNLSSTQSNKSTWSNFAPEDV